MKQRYTITIADMEVNVISDGSPEAVESLVGIVDRKMREILLANRRCSKSEAALLCALDYCSDKLDAMRKQKQLEGALDMKDAELRAAVKEADALRKEIEKLSLELETMKESLRAAHEQQAEARIAAAESAPEAKEEAPAEATEAAEAVDSPEVVQITIEEMLETSAEAPAIEEPEAEREQIAPEDVEFDPTEIFRRAKANRGIRKGGKRKV